ncbi:uncharacterized protein [Lolium perenne]|uniref:uncharacterized protein n=1 Tax=Lolium perenne TaxID=4522 RepID=UPI0021EA577E|nr:uncharacterized protein LOC127336724 [Lolium perenne]
MAPHSSAVKLPSRTAPPPGMGAHRWSHAIAKGPPRKIRIVHVVEPTVIKTDARQFRELVQRLTGKPSAGGGGRGGGGASSSSSSAEIAASESSSSGGSESARVVVAPAAVKAEVKAEEEDAPSPEEEGFASACRDTNGGATTAAGFKAVVKEEADAALPEAEEFARAFGEEDDTFGAFFHGLDDFLLSAFQGDGFSL